MGRSLLALGVGITLVVPFAFADVLVVAPSGAPYTQIQPAIDAAIDGDTILVKSGSYLGFTLDGKSLSIVADVENGVALTGPVLIKNIVAGKCALLAGIRYPAGDLVCATSAGSIRLEALKTEFPSQMGLPGHALRTIDCSDVAVLRCTLRGGQSFGAFPSNPGNGLDCESTRIAVYDSAVFGGRGSDAFYIGTGGSSLPALPGAGGAWLSGTTELLVSGSSITGGQGGKGLSGICFPWQAGGGPGASGGTGMTVDASALAYALDSIVAGGPGGDGGNGGASCGTPPGSPGPAGPNVAGILNSLLGPRAVLRCATHLREGNALALTFEGQPGDQVWLRLAATPQWVLTLPFKGVQLAGPQSRRIPLGTIPANGVLNTSTFFGPLSPGVQSRLWHVQAFLIDTAGNTRCGSGAVFVVLDSAF